MAINALGYMMIVSDKLDDWAAFGPSILGLQLVERTNSALTFRMDDRKQRIIVSRDRPDPYVFGWEVESAEWLDALAARLEAIGQPVVSLSSADCDRFGVSSGIEFSDPAGNRLQAFCGPQIADTPFTAGRPIAGFRTGTQGLGHVVLQVPDITDVLWFYQDVLGFRLSDYMLKPLKAYFFHVNSRHHSLALAETGQSGVHHLMMELSFLDDVGQAYDLALSEPKRVATTLGRHVNDLMTSFYTRTPSQFLVEYGWGGRSIDPATWTPYEMDRGTSLWGHDRDWMQPEQLAESRLIRAKVAADGVRAPVQVHGANYRTGTLPCMWWEDAKRGQAPNFAEDGSP
ncbi:VOC family protein [Bradyrhizobium liaoningense]|uniref:VOC family protein n=1 Tax=Bradyrhizobium liaoningense TaxID=43992 RepID=UPI001BAA03AD|nr:VOC family protein [Bradyrhizobium liaoningense]MBR0840393.1 VOC family protein [Bradyrhizobium liaoningense]